MKKFYVRKLKDELYWDGVDFVKKSKAKKYSSAERAVKVRDKIIERYKVNYDKDIKLEVVSFTTINKK